MSGGNWKEMYAAAEGGDLALVEYHVKRGVDVNYAHPEFLSTPLVATILARQEEVARFLLESGADPRLHSEFDAMTPVEAARHVGLAGLEAWLVQLGATPAPPMQQQRRGWLGRLIGRGRR
ncbi:MAG: ankyrin repeat domain-containing protein [Hydrogenophaga sp.]|uniref:ankyrin repeat domain-containing protein n=1 Tax=Hydrogenophaga sp. TaxID=1904254 RepID=UPI0026168554|nr:ankyrin repeat domain-containing protein [Hydrogenophaga sp.]MDM7941394.1 ankyrin repeat domain-containing protein [Hydrogenophaga sp.]